MSFFIPAAIIGGGTSLLSSVIGGSAASSAAGAQAGAANQATAAQLQMFNQVMGNLQPYMQAGQGALGALEYGLGIGGPYTGGAPAAAPASNVPAGVPSGFGSGFGGGAATLAPQYAAAGYTLSPDGLTVTDQLGNGYLASSFPGVVRPAQTALQPVPANVPAGRAAQAPPGGLGYGSLLQPFTAQSLASNLAPNYQFQLGQGLGQLANVGAATGMSGNTLAGLQSYAQDYASNAYQQAFQNYQTTQGNIYARLGNLAQLGQASSTGAASGAPLFSSGISQTIQGLGQAQAAGTIGVANAISGGLSGIGSAAVLPYFLQNQAMGNMNMIGGTGPSSGYNYLYANPSGVGPPIQ